MPKPHRRPRRQTSVAPCTARTDSTPFVRWGDSAEYFLAPNGDFSGGGADWDLSGGATVVSGGEPYGVVAGDAHSLLVPYGSQAVSETMCVTEGEDAIRLFVKNPGVEGSILHVEALVQSTTTGQSAADGVRRERQRRTGRMDSHHGPWHPQSLGWERDPRPDSHLHHSRHGRDLEHR